MVVNGSYESDVLKKQAGSNYKAIEWIRNLFGETMFYQILALLKTKKKERKNSHRKSVARKSVNPKRAMFKRSLTDIYQMICNKTPSEDHPFMGGMDQNWMLLDDIKAKIQLILSDTWKSSFIGSDMASNEASFDQSISVPFKMGSNSPWSDVPKMFEDEFKSENEKSTLLTQISDMKS